MLRYVPEFVLINAAQNKCRGTLDGFALFVDIVGFTDLSNSLRRQGKKGAEALNNYLSAAISLPIETVHDFGGFVSHFAGDAFCALFPDAEPAHIKAVLDKIRHHYSRMEEFQTDMGSFPIRSHAIIGRNEDVINHEHFIEIAEGLASLYDKCGMQSEAEKYRSTISKD